jgi:phosphate starvation-inducible protein PhoH and related proteins
MKKVKKNSYQKLEDEIFINIMSGYYVTFYTKTKGVVMSKTKSSQKKVTLSELNNHTISNKRQALKDLKKLNFNDLQYKNAAQRRFYKTISSKDITFGIGPAGCGKTYLSVHRALSELGNKDSHIDGIIIVKPLVEAAGEKIGFLPGDVEEKTAPFMMSFYYNMEQIIGKQRMEILKESSVIQVIPMAYMRGITLSDKFVILDEAQNATPEQIKMFVTRIGENSKYVITGDLDQSDIQKHKSGLEDAIKRFAGVHGVGLASFKEKDIVRHSLVRRLLKRYKPSFNVIDDTSAEDTISMWVHDEGLDLQPDGSLDDKESKHFYTLKQ